MTDIVVTTAQVGMLDPAKADVGSYVCAEDVTKGDVVAFDTAGKVRIADANGSYKQVRGIATKTKKAGEVVEVIHEGKVAGYSVSGLNGDAKLYLSNTPGKLSDSVGSTTVVVARVVTLTNKPTLTKVIRVFTQWEADWS